MICKYCNSEMRLDDVDKSFEGNEDHYWICDKCHSSCFEKIRYSRPVGKAFEPPENSGHEVERINNLLYDGCESHWQCIHCGECVPFHCYKKEQLEEMFCKVRFDNEQRRSTK